MKKKKNTTISLIQGKLPPKTKKQTYEWEQQSTRKLEPWHFSSITLVCDVLVLLMYMFVNIGSHYQLPIGVFTLVLGFVWIGSSYYLLMTKNWPISVTRYTKLINTVILSIHIVLTGFTLLLIG